VGTFINVIIVSVYLAGKIGTDPDQRQPKGLVLLGRLQLVGWKQCQGMSFEKDYFCPIRTLPGAKSLAQFSRTIPE
jgi:hypothetical protein